MNVDLSELLLRAGVSEAEVAGLVPTQRSIRFRRYYAASLATGTAYRYLHAGIGDDQTKIKPGGSGEITNAHTNLSKGGTIPKGEVFIAHGMSLETSRTIVIADAEALLEGEFRYEEADGKVRRFLGQGKEFPAIYKPDYHLIQDTTSTGAAAARENYVRLGPPNIGVWPWFVMRGRDQETERGTIIHEVYTAATITADTYVDMRLHGFWFQRTGANELSRRL